MGDARTRVVQNARKRPFEPGIPFCCWKGPGLCQSEQSIASVRASRERGNEGKDAQRKPIGSAPGTPPAVMMMPSRIKPRMVTILRIENLWEDESVEGCSRREDGRCAHQNSASPYARTPKKLKEQITT